MPGPSPDDTIAALATAAEPAARGVVRVAGPRAQAATRTIFTPDDAERWLAADNPQRFTGSLTLPGVEIHGQAVPVPAAVWLWPTDRSYCGQPTAEIHLLGALPLLDATLEGLLAAGVRAAGRGEFTMRAVLAGRLDLLQAEAVLGVIDAPDSDALTRALQQLGGGLSAPLGELRDALTDDLADLEAGLDFVEEDIEFVDRAALLGRIDAAIARAEALLAATQTRLQPPGPPRVVLVGPANAGKSTLLNRLAGREAALVSPVAGTTRDWLAATIEHNGRRLEWIDTAGYLDAAGDDLDPVDAAAARLRDEVMSTASVVISLRPFDAGGVEAATLAELAPDAVHLQCLTQIDRADTTVEAPLAISAVTGDGIDGLLDAVAAAVARSRGDESGLLATTAARCRESLRQGLDALTAARELAATLAGDELIALELRRGLDALGEVLGRVDHEAVLDRLFSRFCIGK